MHKLILLRHGESVWNSENRFTGWTDVELSEKGIIEAKRAGELLRSFGICFDISYTSLLARAIQTQFYVAQETNLLWTPIIKDWRLNERHYGALQGLNKQETAVKYGDDQVKIWRRSFDIAPPRLNPDDPRFPGCDVRYKGLDVKKMPYGESLKDTIDRVLPYWEDQVLPQVKAGKTVLIAAHGNSLRALIKHLDRINDTDIVGVEIPTGTPLIYELNDRFESECHYYLG